MEEKKKSVICKLIKASAVYYANVTCPLFTYQPKVGNGIKKIRKKHIRKGERLNERNVKGSSNKIKRWILRGILC